MPFCKIFQNLFCFSLEVTVPVSIICFYNIFSGFVPFFDDRNKKVLTLVLISKCKMLKSIKDLVLHGTKFISEVS